MKMTKGMLFSYVGEYVVILRVTENRIFETGIKEYWGIFSRDEVGAIQSYHSWKNSEHSEVKKNNGNTYVFMHESDDNARFMRIIDCCKQGRELCTI